MKRLGIDIGSLSLHAALLEDGRVIDRLSFEHAGRVDSAVRSVVEDPRWAGFDLVGVTASLASGPISGAEQSAVIDSTLATIEGARHLLPGCRNVLAMGGQSFSLILLDRDGSYVEHTGNPPCASGTGSFLEQQAERLGVGAPELARRASALTLCGLCQDGYHSRHAGGPFAGRRGSRPV